MSLWLRSYCAVGTLVVAIVIQPLIAQPTPTVASAQWTVLIFMNGDNNLEPDALLNFWQLAQIGSNNDVNVVVQFDRIAKYAHTQPDWAQTLRFRVTQGMQPLPANALQDIGEADMGDPQTLRDFVIWGETAFPAKHFMLIIWDHGQGWRLFLNSMLQKQRSMRNARTFAPTDTAQSQIAAASALRTGFGQADAKGNTAPLQSAPGATFRSASNDETNQDVLYDSEIESGLKAALGGKKLDVIGFDACLMSMLEVGYALRDVGDVLVGSEEVEPGPGWKYHDWLRAIEQQLPQDGPEMARMTVESYKAAYVNNVIDDPTKSTTLSATDLRQISAVASSLSAVADQFMTHLDTYLQPIVTARSATSTYAPGLQFYHVDIAEFLDNMKQQTADQVLLQKIASARSAISSAVIARYAATNRNGPYGSFGLAVYFPATNTDHVNDPYAEGGYEKGNTYYPVEFVDAYHWSDFLHAYWSKVP